MKKQILLIIIIGLQLHGETQDIRGKLDEVISTYAETGRFNGSVLVASKGKIILEKGFGFKNVKEKTYNDANTIYQIASVTKTFTATVILKLVELKKLALTDKLSKFYQGFAKGDSITIEHLLTHTSGISDHSADTTMAIYKGSDEKGFIADLRKRASDFSPGTSWHYSNSGYILLGYIIQKITGKSYYDAVKQYIFKPLSMDHSAFDFIQLESSDKATGYWTFPEDETEAPATIIDSSAPRAAGSIYSTVADMYKWHRGLQGEKILGHLLLRKAYTPNRNNYGYGWGIDSFANKKIVSHGGDIWGFQSEFARVPEDDVCIILLSNVEETDLHVIRQKILSILYDKPYRLPARNKFTLTAAQLQDYTGDFEMKPGMIIKITVENGHLIATTDRRQELFTARQDCFLIEAGDDQKEITFERDNSGGIVALSFEKMGEKIVCKKNIKITD